MQKPITYFVETPAILEFCEAYGSHAQVLNAQDKIRLVTTIAAYAKVLISDNPEIEDVTSNVYDAFQAGFDIYADAWFIQLRDIIATLSWQESIQLILALLSNI